MRDRTTWIAHKNTCVYGRLIKMLVVGTVIILLTALVAGIMTGSMWITIRQQQAEKASRQNPGAIVIQR